MSEKQSSQGAGFVVAGLVASYFAQSFASYLSFPYAGFTEFMAACLFMSLLGGWIVRDSFRRGKLRAYDFDTLVAVLWILLAPLYLLKTRRWRGALIIVIAIVAALLLDNVAYGIADAIWSRSF